MTTAIRVKEIIAAELGVEIEEVTDDARLGEQLGADSLDALELTIALEEEFGIEIPDGEAAQLLRVGHVVAYIQAHVGTAAVS